MDYRDMVDKYPINGSYKNCDEPVKTMGKVESALGNLSERTNKIGKITADLLDLIQYPKPQTASTTTGMTLASSDLTLAEQIYKIDSRIDDAAEGLALAIDIIRQNLGSIKLD